MMRQRAVLRTLVVVSIIFAFHAAAKADWVLFTFDSLAAGDDASAIESYMESEYGAVVGASSADITVENAQVHGGLGSGPLGTDSFIRNAPGTGWHVFGISFEDDPITAVSFEWAMESESFHARADGVEFFYQGYGTSSGSTSHTFESPVTTLEFSDSESGYIAIDNLSVNSSNPTPVPEGSTLLLFGSGLSGLLLIARKKGLFKF